MTLLKTKLLFCAIVVGNAVEGLYYKLSASAAAMAIGSDRTVATFSFVRERGLENGRMKNCKFLPRRSQR